MIVLYKIFINTLSIVIYIYLAQSIYGFQRKKKVFIKFVIAAGLGVNILVFADRYIGMGIRAAGVLLLLILLSIYLMKLKLIQTIVCSITYSIVLAIGDITAASLMVNIYGYAPDMIKSHFLLSITMDLIIYGIAMIIIFLIRLLGQTQEMVDNYKRSISVRTLLYMLATFIIIAVNHSIYAKLIETIDHNILLVNIAILWLYLILSLYINFSNSALALKEQQYDQQQDYIRTIDSLINDFRRLKHSYANTLYSFYGYIQDGDLPGLKAYYAEIMDDAKRTDSNLLLALQRIKIYAIFGLLWNKINEATGKEIEVGLKVANEVREAGMRLTDLCEVIGNYLDNAIEAAAASETKRINISLTDDGGYLTICIENTCGDTVDVKEIQRKGYSTKGDGRGFGLALTNQILTGYTNILHNTFSEEGIFRQELIIRR
ncbi:MAG TPA: GHKL domain-containing protein [Bacillota bacterium]|nr:GHKL domain-containing protein [Bacillota bacterium]HOR86180.1 GHKL domain-containing protein [Bacillota bacterium]